VVPGIGRSHSESRRPGRWIATCASGAGTHTPTRRGSGWAAEAARPWMLMGQGDAQAPRH
jgi:hypothetical protein